VDGNKENNLGGCPSKLSAHDKQSIVRQIKSGKLDNAVQATQFINGIIPNPVTPQTVRNALKKNQFYAATKKTPLLKCAHHIWHLQFARYHENWTVEDWKRILWTDETKINRIGSDGKVYIWKQREEPLSNHLPSNIEEEETSWYGVVWSGMEWESS
jgi:hypothetical protein